GPGTQAQSLAELSRLSMIVLRYPDPTAAKSIASQLAALGPKKGTPEVELVAQTDRSGRTRVSDPRFGSAALGKNNIAGWGGLGLVSGAIAGAAGGGVIGLISSGVVTGVVWGLFGLGAGALYGLWAGRVISARRLKPIRGLMPDNSSTLV